MKKNKGITLIALILTIIILLILAMVTINAITGDDDLIGYSKNAAGKYQEEQENENGLLQSYLNKMEEIGTGAENKEEHNNPSETPAEVPDVLKRYILGPDETGRSLLDIIDTETFTFIADPAHSRRCKHICNI